MNDYDLQEALVKSKLQRYQQQAQTPAPQGQMIGKTFVAPNVLEYLAAGLRGYGGMKGAAQTETDMTGLAQRKQTAMADALRKFGESAQGTPAQPGFEVPANEMDGQQTQMNPVAAKAPDMMGGYQQLMTSGFPELQKMGMQGALEMPKLQAQEKEHADNRAWRTAESVAAREARAAEAQAARDARAADLQARLADARTSQQERLAAQKELRQMQIDAQKEMKQLVAGMAGQKQKTQYDPVRGGIVDLQTGEFKPAMQGGVPIGPKATPLKDPPASVQKAMMENSSNLRKAQNALDLIEGKKVGVMQGDTEATGWKGFAPDFALNRLDPAGVDTRAAIADLGSMIIHERSGAAVTAAEFPRLQPFIPKPNDAPEVAKKKLQRFVQVYNEELTAMQNAYGPDSGYRQPGGITPKPPGAPNRIKLDAQGNVIP
jgi:predicted metal-dependent hydrolase